jgi:ABC-type transport system involved in multi-copper enzyme maturation permease subunit
MRQLCWKDYRMNRGLLIFGLLVLIGVYVVGLAIEISYTWPAMPARQAWADALCSYGHLAFSLLPFLAALLGGNAIACERADRSAHFLAYLPAAKSQIVTSKFTVAACAVAIFSGGNLAVMYAVAPLLAAKPDDFMYMFGPPSATFAGCVFTFGIGWLGSACLEKPTYPVLAALVSPFVLAYALFLFAAVSGISRFEVAEWTGAVGLVIGCFAFALGTWSYFRRVEP